MTAHVPLSSLVVKTYQVEGRNNTKHLMDIHKCWRSRDWELLHETNFQVFSGAPETKPHNLHGRCGMGQRYSHTGFRPDHNRSS